MVFMRKQPFHRKILPLIFVIAFIGVAPSLVFYTAGYRWNPKKGKIERNGTVIIDSVPTSANITIDGRPIPEKTPVTIQNMAPGVHKFLVSKNGYHSWEKTFDVIAEKVTFANDIKLFKRSEPILSHTLEIGKISLSTDRRSILHVPSGTSTEMSLINTRSPGSKTSVGLPPNSVRTITWSSNGRYALLETTDDAGASWLVHPTGETQLTQLPSGRYRWEGSRLVGIDGKVRNEIRLPLFSFTRTPLAPRSVDELDSHSLRTATGTLDVVYVDERTPQQGFVLPRKNWTFWSEEKNGLVLRDGRSWLSLTPHNSGVDFYTAQGDALIPDPASAQPHFLLVHDSELWSWDILSEPVLLLRQSDRLIQASWDIDGKNVIYATKQKLIALNLDTRDGRLETTLAEFDLVHDLVVAGKTLYVLATKNGANGLWAIEIE